MKETIIAMEGNQVQRGEEEETTNRLLSGLHAYDRRGSHHAPDKRTVTDSFCEGTLR